MSRAARGTVARGPRLLCVYQHAPTPGAPGIYRHRRYFAELVRRGWHVDLVSTPRNYMTGLVPDRYAGRPYTHELIDGIHLHWVWASGGIHATKARRAANYATFAAAALARAGTLSRPDVVLASSPPLPVGTLGPLLHRRFRAPWLLEVRDIWPESAASVGWLDPESRLYRAVDRVARRLTSNAAAVVVPTPGLVAGVRSHGARRVEVIPGPVTDDAGPPERRDAVRAELGVPAGTCLAVYVGAIGVANGLDILLDAAALVPREVPLSILIVGDGSARETIARRIDRERLQNVTILPAVPKEQVTDYLAASDVCLHLLRPDPVFAAALPTKVLEYFSAHRAFITTMPGLPEQLALESGGSFAPSASALAAELERWARLRSEEREARGERSFEYGVGRFGLVSTVDQLEQVLRSVLPRSAG
jgi:glycosyltransferase involved in cell wall biosynthesis